METVVYRRNELYEKVWSRPAQEVAAEYGLTGRGLAKVCARLRVPVSPRGYWAKRQHGHEVPRPPLPPLRHGDTEQLESPRPRFPKEDARDGRILREVQSATERLVLPAQLIDPHPLVDAAAKTLRASGVDDDGLLRARTPGRLGIRVTPETLDRALRIMDVVIKTLTAHGYTVGVGDDKEKSVTFVVVDDERVEFALTEETTAVERQLSKTQMIDKLKNPWKYSRPEYDHVPTGRLTITITNLGYSKGTRAKYSDGTSARLDRNLHTVVVGLVAAGKKKHLDRVAQEKRHREWEEQQRREETERRHQEREERRWKLLRRDLGDWQLAEQIRAYVRARRERLSAANIDVRSDTPLGKFLQWAADAADRLDPTRSKAPPKARPGYSWEQEPEDEW